MNYVLALDTASPQPSLAIGDTKGKTIHTRSLVDRQTGRYDATTFVGQIIDSCTQVNAKPEEFVALIYCNGPGGFSSLRVGAVFARLFAGQHTHLKVHQLSLPYLLRASLGRTEKVFYLEAGARGYFREAYDHRGQILEEASLVQQITTTEDHYLFAGEYPGDLACTMLHLYWRDKLNAFSVADPKDIMPAYVRPASVTARRSA